MAAFDQRDFAGAAPTTALAGSLTAVAGSFAVTAGGGTGFPTGSNGSFWVVIDRGNSKEEKVLCSARSTDTFTVAGTRGDNTDGTTAVAHSAGAAVEHCFSKQDLYEANLAVARTIGKATAVGQVLVADGVNSFAAVQGKTSGQLLIGNGTTLVSVAVTGDVTITSGGVTAIGSGKVTSAMIVDGTIVNADINASAAIALSKLATIADARILGNNTGGASVPIVLTAAQVKTLLAIAAGDVSGLGALAVLDTVGTAEIDALSVTTAKLAAAAVTTAELAATLGRGALTSGYAQATSSQTGIVSITDLTSLTVTVTVRAGSRIKITGKTNVSSDIADDSAKLSIRESSTTLNAADTAPLAAGQGAGLPVVAILTPSTGSHTYKLSLGRSNGSGTLTSNASSTEPAFILVEDIGA